MPPTIVTVLGRRTVETGPALPALADPGDLRGWAAELAAAPVEDLRAELRLPLLEALLDRLAARDGETGDEIAILLVVTDQSQLDDASHQHTDTAPLGELVCRHLGTITERHRLRLTDTKLVPLEVDPTDDLACWTHARKVAAVARALAGADRIHLLRQGGAPVLTTALALCLYEEAERDRAEVEGWRPVGDELRADEVRNVLRRDRILTEVRHCLDDMRFEDAAELVRDNRPIRGADEFVAICELGHRILQLDITGARDLAMSNPGVIEPETLTACDFRREDGSAEPGRTGTALQSLVPLFSLMLELEQVRWEKGDMLGFLTVLHLISDYLPHLVWEGVLGHAADPYRLDVFAAHGSLWATDDCRQGDRTVEATRRASDVSAGRLLLADYLARDHTSVGNGLLQCAVRKRHDPYGSTYPLRYCTQRSCGVWSQLDTATAADLERRATATATFRSNSSPVLALRHTSPAGHFFGVPSAVDVAQALADTLDAAAQYLGETGEARPSTRDDVIRQLEWFITAVAGKDVTSATHLHRLQSHARSLLPG